MRKIVEDIKNYVIKKLAGTDVLEKSKKYDEIEEWVSKQGYQKNRDKKYKYYNTSYNSIIPRISDLINKVDEVVPYNIAWRLKEIGFNYRCYYHWNTAPAMVLKYGETRINDDRCENWNATGHLLSDPSWTSVQEWLLNKYYIYVRPSYNGNGKWSYTITNTTETPYIFENLKSDSCYDSFKTALKTGISECVNKIYSLPQESWLINNPK